MNSTGKQLKEIFPDRRTYSKLFLRPVAEGLYNNIRSSGFLRDKNGEFKSLTKSEQSFWLEFTESIPVKYHNLGLDIRVFENFCRTCIITDDELTKFTNADNEALGHHRSWQHKIKEWEPFLKELNYFVPAELKKLGFEISRYEEISEIGHSLIRKLAKSIHSRYLHEIRIQSRKSKKTGLTDPYAIDFEELPEDIKNSNIDNAAHIPTKLLSIGYKMRPVKKGFRPFALHLNDQEIETMARVEHLRWSWEKRLNGWRFGELKNENKKTHPSLIPYEQLSEAEKEKDRELVRLIPAFLKDINFEAAPLSPNRIRKLSYAIKPQSSIHRILEETAELNEQIRRMVTIPPEIEQIIATRNRKIDEAIKEVVGSYNYAQHIQQTYLPDDFYVRETFPDSFILFKPKDIVSGDFYFFSKHENEIVFAVGDCTGHGIPGAMLSTLGYGILDQAVNEIKLSDPSEILHHLYSKIHRYLRRDVHGAGITDDMDIVLCTLNTRTNILIYAGVKNPVYLLRKGELMEHPSQNSTDGCNEEECSFKSTRIQLKNSDTIYLFSDGFSDQFGGKRHKRYQTSRFKNFLKNIHSCSMPEQSDKLYEEIEKWREENNEDQTDDILILGIRI